MKKVQLSIILLISFLILIIISIYFSSISGFFINKEKNAICKDCNVVFITIDALRADHLGCYGYSSNTSPNIDKLENESILFENAFSQSSWTLPCMTTVFTSIYPYLYEDVNKEEYLLLSKSVNTFPEILKENGYLTAGFVDACYMNSYFGFNKGFDIYDDRSCTNIDFLGIKNIENNVFEFLNKNKQSKFFLYLHILEVHDAKNVSEYDKNILYEDEGISIILNKLKELNLAQKTIIIITADHGQEIFDHGNFGHGYTLYDEVIHVPLIIKIPFINHKIIENQVGSIDIAPTILDLLNISIPEQFQGNSFVPLIMGYEKENETVYSKLQTLISLRRNDFKFIYDTKTNYSELYYLRNDPKEKINLAEENSSITKELKNELMEWLKSVKEKASNLNISISEYQYPTIGLPRVNVNESSLFIISFNPDIIYNMDKLQHEDSYPFSELPQDFWGSWYSNGDYYNSTSYYSNKTNNFLNKEGRGIVLIHPQNFTTPSFLAQNITLGNDAYVLVAEYGEIASYFNSSCGDSDAIIKIKILDIDKNVEVNAYEDIIKESDGWKKVALVLNAYAGKNITFKIEGYAGGSSEWCGEYAAVNKFYIGKINEKLNINETLEEKIKERLKELGYIK